VTWLVYDIFGAMDIHIVFLSTMALNIVDKALVDPNIIDKALADPGAWVAWVRGSKTTGH